MKQIHLKNLLIFLLCLFGAGRLSAQSCNANFAGTFNNTTRVYNFVSTATASSTITAWYWNFGDTASGVNNTASGISATHTFSKPGIYNVCHTIETSDGCKDSVYMTFSVSPCFARFYYSAVDSGHANGYTAWFWDYSEGNPTAWSWDFGDGGTSNVQNPTHTYNSIGDYLVCLTISTDSCSDTYCDTVHIKHAQAYLYGIVYRDANGNGVQEQGEPGIKNRIIEVWPGPVYLTTHDDGYYWAMVDSGSYLIQSPPPSGWTQTEPSSPDYYTPTIDWGQYQTGYDFGQKPDSTVQDLQVNITNLNGARPGFASNYQIDYMNLGGKTMNGTVTLNHDPDLVYTSSSPAGTYSSGTSSATWNFTNLLPGEKRSIDVSFNVPNNQPLNDTLRNYVMIDPVTGDESPDNNKDSSVVRVAGSYDPNDKAVQPAGLTALGYIAKDQELTYTVRFQNTGNADAINVRVEDELDSDLDIATLKVISASHSFLLDLADSKKLTWSFNNIYLPDSSSNEAASHGFIKYSIKPKSTVMDGDQIHNTAYIYFDFNSPVVTNTTQNTFGSPNGIAASELITLQLSPNPVHTTSTLMLGQGSKEGYTVRILDVTGREVKTMKDVKQGSLTISREGLENGMYFIQVSSGKELIGKAKFIIH